MLLFLLISTCLVRKSLAVYTDYFPPPPRGVTVLDSKLGYNATLSYKKTDICETSFSGYVHLSAAILSDVEGPPEYDMNVFYWFFPARESPDTAPFSIWVGGGPGESAIAGAVIENGPCYVNADGNSTITNPFSRNNRVNMLFVDQPLGAGFSYSSLVNATYSQLTNAVTLTDFTQGIPFTPNITVIPGTVNNPDLAFTANNSDIAAKGMWHFAQVWFQTFPFYNPQDAKISLWTNSYGGYYAPAIFRWWEIQNEKIQAGQLQAHQLQLETLGIENGCIDAVSQALAWPHFAFNNTYDFPMINESVYNEIVQSVTKPDDGCIAVTQQCRQLGNSGDPQFYANNETVNDFCSQATEQCFPILDITEEFANRNAFDIAQIGPESFPGFQHVAFFNQRWVQEGLGVPLNYSDNANLTTKYFVEDADAFRQNQSSIEYLLDNNVQVALVYGDRDSRCNWIGVENVSLTVDYRDSKNFRAAGYVNISTNGSHAVGVVRQYDSFSFSRIFNAGHQVSAFQPEAVSKIFDRVMFHQDVATGQLPVNSQQQSQGVEVASPPRSHLRSTGLSQSGAITAPHYQSKGPFSSWSFKNTLPSAPPLACNVWAAAASCTEDQLAALANGTAVTRDFNVVSPTA